VAETPKGPPTDRPSLGVFHPAIHANIFHLVIHAKLPAFAKIKELVR
jgi:hypothetical protein